MRYVDEFRNAEIARAVSAEISAITDPQRHYKLMEVCGGHTHTIYRHGIKDLLPDQIELVHVLLEPEPDFLLDPIQSETAVS